MDSECSSFTVKLNHISENGGSRVPAQYPRGGHNYYNNRDMERLLRRMGWLELTKLGDSGWEKRYRARLLRRGR